MLPSVVGAAHTAGLPLHVSPSAHMMTFPASQKPCTAGSARQVRSGSLHSLLRQAKGELEGGQRVSSVGHNRAASRCAGRVWLAAPLAAQGPGGIGSRGGRQEGGATGCPCQLVARPAAVSCVQSAPA